jgi:hypothetical protein
MLNQSRQKRRDATNRTEMPAAAAVLAWLLHLDSSLLMGGMV